VISERWQAEVAETVFETVNQEADKMEQKKKAKQKLKFDTDEKGELLFINMLCESLLVIIVFGKDIQIMYERALNSSESEVKSLSKYSLLGCNA
jgi:hypothetical protein